MSRNLRLKLHNPGHIRRRQDGKPELWQGLAEQKDFDFLTFKSDVWGIRAIAVTLHTYADKRRARDGSAIDTCLEIAQRWAPENENPTSAYAGFLAKALNVRIDQSFDILDPVNFFRLIKAVIRFENGHDCCSDDDIRAGINKAGVAPPQKAVSRSATANGAGAVAATGGIGAVVGTISAVEPALPVLHQISNFAKDNPHVLLIVVGVVVLVAAAFIARDFLNKRKREEE